MLLFGPASTKEEEFSSPSDEIVNPRWFVQVGLSKLDYPTEKSLIKPKEEIQLPGEENTGTTAL